MLICLYTHTHTRTNNVINVIRETSRPEGARDQSKIEAGVCVSTPVSKDTSLAIPTTSARQSAVMYRKSAGGASSPSSLAPTKTLDVCW